MLKTMSLANAVFLFYNPASETIRQPRPLPRPLLLFPPSSLSLYKDRPLGEAL